MTFRNSVKKLTGRAEAVGVCLELQTATADVADRVALRRLEEGSLDG